MLVSAPAVWSATTKTPLHVSTDLFQSGLVRSTPDVDLIGQKPSCLTLSELCLFSRKIVTWETSVQALRWDRLIGIWKLNFVFTLVYSCYTCLLPFVWPYTIWRLLEEDGQWLCYFTNTNTGCEGLCHQVQLSFLFTSSGLVGKLSGLKGGASSESGPFTFQEQCFARSQLHLCSW